MTRTGSHRDRAADALQVAGALARRSARHRITGLAAEMSFFALLALVPLTVAFGSALGYARVLVGAERVGDTQDALVGALAVVLSPDLARAVSPYVRQLLTSERGGLAVGGLLVTSWLASRVFASTIHGLDLAHGMVEQRPGWVRRLIAFGLALGSLIVVPLLAALTVVGPLLGTARQLAVRFRLGRAFELAWGVGRWPFLLLLLVGFLICVYRFAPAVDHGWRRSLPGAVLAVILWMAVAASFRSVLAVRSTHTALASSDEVVAVIARVVAAVIATVLWTFLLSASILLGGELNAELAGRRADDEG